MKINEIICEAVNLELTLEKFSDKLNHRKITDHSAKELSANAILSRMISSDPTPNQKYVLKWILPRYLSGGIRYLEDLSRTKTALSIFDKNKSRIEVKDIQQIKSLSDLEYIVEQFIDTKSQNELKKEEKDEIYKETNFIYKGPEGILLSPMTKEASIFWGKGTRWCTAATSSENMFDYYNRKGPLYIVIMPDGRKYQFHLETGSFMNEQDRSIDWKSISFFVFKITSAWSEEKKIEQITYNGEFVKYIENPSEEICEIAVNNNPWSIEYIQNQSEKIQERAVSRNPFTIRYIKNPSEKIQIRAVKSCGLVIEYIKNPSEKVQMMAVEKYALNIEKIKIPTENVQLCAVSQLGGSIEFIKNPTEKVKLVAVKQDGMAIQFIKNPSEEIQIAAIRNNVEYIEYINNPTEKVQLMVIDITRGRGIRYINKPCEKAQLAAIGYNREFYRYIRQRSESVKEKYLKGEI